MRGRWLAMFVLGVACGPSPTENQPPALDDFTIMTTEDMATRITLAAIDPDDDPITVELRDAPAHGTVTIEDLAITYAPAANYAGPDQFTVAVSDGTHEIVATGHVTIGPVNDAPVGVMDMIAAAEDTLATTPMTALLANDTDPDGDTLSITAVGNATHGTVAIAGSDVTFLPAANFNGVGTFTYTLTDGTESAEATVMVSVGAANDPPIAVDDNAVTQTDTSVVIPIATLLANDSDGGDGGPLTITAVQNTGLGVATLGATTITFTPGGTFAGTTTFDYTVSDGGATDTGTVHVLVTRCGDGAVQGLEACDDGNTAFGDGCSTTCTVESGFTCTGAPSTCTTTCGDAIPAGAEQCDDGNADDTDGCTTQCRLGRFCNATVINSGDHFAVDPATGTCYVAFDDTHITFADAESACEFHGGHLATITSAAEDALVTGLVVAGQSPWIGARDDANDVDAVFDWVTDEAFGFAHFAPNQPDDDVGIDGNGECLQIVDTSGAWNDTNCDIGTFVVGMVCELPRDTCGDGIVQTSRSEECDDGNTTSGDGCNSTCGVETGCGNGVIDPGEECDDDNLDPFDSCNAACQVRIGCGNGAIEGLEECDDDNVTSGDGCSSECTIENVHISEYVEGSSNNKAVEIKNPFSTPFNLATNTCQVRVFANGGTTATSTINLTGTIAAGDVYVLCNTSAVFAATCDQLSGSVNFNGDDAVELRCNATALDVIGQIGFDPGTEWGANDLSTADNTLRRRCIGNSGRLITHGDPDGTDDFEPELGDWAGLPIDTFDGLGNPACVPLGGP